MKKITLLLAACFISFFASSQTVCDSTGNLMIFTNYDGGVLNINVDVNVPDLKIGVVSYEGITINLTGPYVNNVTAVSWAGFNGSNAHCGSVINTSINGAPTGASTSIIMYPTAGLSNTNGNMHIVCGYSCSIDTYQGGCNTVDQIEDYFLTLFAGSSLYAHKVQYGCWGNEQLISDGGTCCGLVTGIAKSKAQTELQIYPNPAVDNLYLLTTGTVARAKCYNNMGQLSELKVENNTIDVSILPSGMYFLMLDMENGEQVMRRFVKE